MPTQEERITLLEHVTREYRPVLQDISYELTMVKGLIVEQVTITQELRRDMDEVKAQLTGIDEMKVRLTTIEEQLRQVLMLLRPS